MIKKIIIFFYLNILTFLAYAGSGDEVVFNTTILLFIIGGVLSILGWLLVRAINNQDSKIEEIKVVGEHNAARIEEFNDKLNEVNLKILKDINEILVKIAEFKRDGNVQ